MTGLAVRHVPLVRPPGWRIAAALLVLGAALAGAALLYWHRFVYSCPPESLVLCRGWRTPDWVGPTALAICLVGVAGAAALLLVARRSNPE
jgi:hypothetical protein